MTDFYIDSRATGANDGDPGAVTGPDGSGIFQDAWQSIAAAEAVNPYVGGDTVSFVVGSGPYRETLEFAGNGIAGTPIVWNTTVTGQKVEISAGDDMNDAAFKWTLSASGTNEYYLELSGGGDPSLVEVKSATVSGYYRGSSAEASRQRQAPGSLDNISFGWGDNDTLGFSTLYVRVDSGTPDTVEVTASQRNFITDTNFRDHEMEDLVFSYGNTASADARGRNWVYRRCAFIFPDFTGIISTTSDVDITAGAIMISCIFFWAGHRAVNVTSASDLACYNCTDVFAHLFALADTGATADSKLTFINNISLEGEAGAIDKKSSLTVLTESNNLWYPRMTAASGDLGYLTPTNWTPTDNSDMPPATLTNKNATGGGLGRSNYPNLKDPLLTRIAINNFQGSNFNLEVGSPAISAGVNWWTAISEPLPLDYYGNTFDADNINLGASQAVNSPNGIMSPIMSGKIMNSRN